MDWASDAQRAMVGEEAAVLRGRAEAMRGMGIWPDDHVMRFKLLSGEAAWLRVTKDGALQCVALAPWDDRWQVDVVSVAAFFGLGTWPAGWRRKLEVLGPIVQEGPGYECGWCVGLLEDRIGVVLCKPEAWTGRTLHSVQVELDGPALSVTDHSAIKWWPYGKYEQGIARLWAAKRTSFANYRFLAISASNEMRRLGLLPKVVRKPRQSSKD